MPLIHFLGGMPRAGSTLLCNILAQNPLFHATATSGVLEILTAVRRDWTNIDSFRACPNDHGKFLVLKSILEGYHSEAPRPIVIDKSRGWLAHVEMVEQLLGRKIKVIVPVRDIRDIIASFELIHRNNPLHPLPQEKLDPLKWQTLEGRVEIWLSSDSPVGSAYNRIKDAVQRGLRDRMLFVPFEQLTVSPERVMDKIYDWLEVPRFDHDFNHVEQVTFEDDAAYGFPPQSLHTIRQQVRPVPTRWRGVIPPDLAAGIAVHNKLFV